MAILPKIKQLYRALPPWMTAGVRLVPDGLVFGNSYRDCRPSVNNAGCGRNIKNVLEYARIHTVWGKNNIPAGIRISETEEALKSLPVVGSEDLAAAPELFISDESTEVNSYWTTTGGSGRNPTNIRLSNASFGTEWKHMHSIWNSCAPTIAYSRSKDVKLTFRGYHLREGELIRFDPIYNEVSVDSFQLNEGNFKRFLESARKYKISCIHGYPSLISLFMERLINFGETFKAKLIFLGSEGACVELKRQLSEFFGARVVSWYGQTEKVILAYDADANGQFVNFSSYGYPWILNPDENGIGEIIGTTFVNKAMPLINYRTGDYGRVTKQTRKDACGVEHEVLVIDKLQGRWGKDFVYRTSSERIPTSAINLHGRVQERILFYQMIQNEPGKLLVKVLPKNGCSQDSVTAELGCELSERLKGFEIKCIAVRSDAEFVRSSRGKMIMLVQNMKAEK